ncbi:MAG TPA: hypothetical protein PKG52_01395 [bacterium]|nr:hypothetical protein [bacterium]HPS29229.1 hypothetical protein [bacterium]
MLNKYVPVFLAAFSVFMMFFSSCSLPESKMPDVMKILEIREAKLNAGDIKSVELLIADSFPDRKSYLQQLNLQQQYFLKYSYSMNSTKVISSSMIPGKIEMEVDYDLFYRAPEDVAETYIIGKKETIKLVKERIGWKIADIKEISGAGRKIDANIVHDIFFTLDTRKTALNNGDVELFSTIIDQSYKGRAELLDNFRKNAEAFINVNYGLNSRDFQYISPSMDEARVVQHFNLVFKVKGLDSTEKVEDQKEIISLKKSSNGSWTITDGLK